MNSHTRDIVEVFQCFEIGIKLKVISFQTFLVQTTEIMSIFKSNFQILVKSGFESQYISRYLLCLNYIFITKILT